MQAHVITRTGENSWRDEVVFETVQQRLEHADTPPSFKFPQYINWHLIALVGIPAAIGLVGGVGLGMLVDYLFPD